MPGTRCAIRHFDAQHWVDGVLGDKESRISMREQTIPLRLRDPNVEGPVRTRYSTLIHHSCDGPSWSAIGLSKTLLLHEERCTLQTWVNSRSFPVCCIHGWSPLSRRPIVHQRSH